MKKFKAFLSQHIAAYLSFYVLLMLGAMLLSLGIMIVSIMNMANQRASSYKAYEIDVIFENYRQEDMFYALEHSDGLIEYMEFLNEDKQIKDEAGSPHDFGYQYSEQEFTQLQKRDNEFMIYYPYKDTDDAFIVYAPKLAGPAPMMDIVIYHLVGFVLLVVVLLALLMFQLRYQFVRPIIQMKHAVEKISQGEYAIEIDYKSDNELNVLKHAIIQMGDTINQQLTALHQAEIERKRMILSLSHDIRTPLTNIAGYAETLKNEFEMSEEEKQKAIGVIYNNTQRAKQLISGLFDYAKYDSEQLKVDETLCDITDCLRASVIDYYPEFEAKAIVVDVQLPEEDVWIPLDRGLFERLIGNLLSNSLRYAHSPGAIKVVMNALQDPGDGGTHVHIFIEDEGPGIPESISTTLFDPFVTGDEARTHRTGTGLGLTIAKRLAERLGGVLAWDSTYKMGVRWHIALYRKH